MKKLALITAISAISISQALATTYNTSGNATGTLVEASFDPSLTYTAPNATPSINGDWNFTFSGSTVDFNGAINLGDYTTHTSVNAGFLGSMTGDVSYDGAVHDVSGTADWDDASKTLTYSLTPPIDQSGGNSGLGSNGSYSNVNCSGNGSIFGNTICGAWGSTNYSWEGLVLNLVFSSDLSSFSGSLTGIENSGSGITYNVTSLFYDISGNAVADVPVPAAAWLFGSALIGLAGLKRKK